MPCASFSWLLGRVQLRVPGRDVRLSWPRDQSCHWTRSGRVDVRTSCAASCSQAVHTQLKLFVTGPAELPFLFGIQHLSLNEVEASINKG